MKRCLLLLMLAGCSTTVQQSVPGIVAAPPPSPAMKSITSPSAAAKSYEIQLWWNPYTAPGVTSLRVWRGTTPAFFSLVNEIPSSWTTVQVGGQNYNTQYYFRLTAFGPNGESAPSTTCSYFKQNANKPGIPGNSAQ